MELKKMISEVSDIEELRDIKREVYARQRALIESEQNIACGRVKFGRELQGRKQFRLSVRRQTDFNNQSRWMSVACSYSKKRVIDQIEPLISDLQDLLAELKIKSEGDDEN